MSRIIHAMCLMFFYWFRVLDDSYENIQMVLLEYNQR